MGGLVGSAGRSRYRKDGSRNRRWIPHRRCHRQHPLVVPPSPVSRAPRASGQWTRIWREPPSYGGIEGFGESSTLHAAHILRLSEDLPIVIECVDTSDNIEDVLPTPDEMIGDGLVTIERVDVRVYRADRE
ncbi:MAG TPA: DUF190 domain-containing protein [Acidimicrobiia bacterium]